MGENSTKEKILDEAEKLFVNNGFAATSLRAIIKEARVNTAAIHYHFGSKEDLIKAVFSRRADQVKSARLAKLDELEARYPSEPIPLEDVVRTFLRFLIIIHTDPSNKAELIPRLMGRAITEADPVYRRIVHDAFKETFERFSRALGRALPGLSREEIMWRIHMMVGAVVFTVVVPGVHPTERIDFQRARDVDLVTERLVRFLVAGMQTTPPERSDGKETT